MKQEPCHSNDWTLKAIEYAMWPGGLSPAEPFFANNFTITSEEDNWGVQVHEGFEVSIVLEGTLSFELKDTVKVLQKGDVWLCGAWEPHAHELMLSKFVLLTVVFIPQFLGDERFGDISWEDLFAAPAKDRPWVNTPEMRHSALTIAQALRKEIVEFPPGWESAVRLSTLNLLFLLSRNWQPPAQRVQPCFEADNMHRILPSLHLVREDPARHITVAEAAAACALNATSFRILFRKQMGMRFAEYRLQYRLSYVAKQLMTTTETLDAIAVRAGFYDASHLHNIFTKHYGCTPGKYRASQTNGNKTGKRT